MEQFPWGFTLLQHSSDNGAPARSPPPGGAPPPPPHENKQRERFRAEMDADLRELMLITAEAAPPAAVTLPKSRLDLCEGAMTDRRLCLDELLDRCEKTAVLVGAGTLLAAERAEERKRREDIENLKKRERAFPLDQLQFGKYMCSNTGETSFGGIRREIMSLLEGCERRLDQESRYEGDSMLGRRVRLCGTHDFLEKRFLVVVFGFYEDEKR